MVAPNGARRSKSDHPALPITNAEITETAVACAAAGADAIHVHVRDANGKHCLDANLYLDLLARIAKDAPALQVQVTTEAAGIYTPAQQRELLYTLQPQWQNQQQNLWASASLKELLSDGDRLAAKNFYHWCADTKVHIQHILYTPDEVTRLRACIVDGVIPTPTAVRPLEVLFVLGRYTAAADDGDPAQLTEFIAPYRTLPAPKNFMVCAFGKSETACLVSAAKSGGSCRVGFENNFYHANGTRAAHNAERTTALLASLHTSPISNASK